MIYDLVNCIQCLRRNHWSEKGSVPYLCIEEEGFSFSFFQLHFKLFEVLLSSISSSYRTSKVLPILPDEGLLHYACQLDFKREIGLAIE